MPSYVIIGASRGIGYQFLRSLSRNPSNTVVATARDPTSTLEKVSNDKLSNVHVLAADLTDAASLSAAADETSKLTGGVVDYLIINGAYVSQATATQSPTAFAGQESLWVSDLTTSIATNVTGTLYSINAFLPLVRASSIKKIVVTSSGMADTDLILTSGAAGGVPYTLSKAAVNALVAKYAAEFEDTGIVIIALSPGLVLTSWDSLEDPQAKAMYGFLDKWFKRYEPNFKGPILPEESVDMQLKVIEKVTTKDSGKFLSHREDGRWI
ncbi:NAD(P)-binding protein [Lophiostoma macrostomum CBS 122681]|uniref:NAD(P)-binding protein n=1 Tax=Lophiostoma macrostomum CBS 122681 TaxID=1314788 RepID=A0A6A6TJR7_9PLEO|nr:NAD(P)-binding protein [Lophiostoma macrostomum CBS 122681]